MSNLVKRKQLDWVFSSTIQIMGFTTGTSSSDVVTSIITTTLSSAGRGGSSVPLTISSDEETQGLIVVGDFARSEIQLSLNKDKISGDSDNNEVYGRLSESGGTYTLSYFYLADTGVETPYTFTSPTNIDFSINYRFIAANIPADAIISQLGVQVSQDVGGSRQKLVKERIGVTATNTFANLSQTISDPTQLVLIINGIRYELATGEPVTLTGQTPGWDASSFGPQNAWNVEPTDTVFAQYPTSA